MSKRLKVELPRGWTDHSSRFPNGPLATFLRDESDAAGAVQVSTAEFRGQKAPDLSVRSLVAMAVNLGKQPGFELTETTHGTCEYGTWGSAVYRSDQYSRAKYWFLSDGRDVIFATHICQASPEPSVVSEVEGIVKSLRLARRPWW